MLWDRVRAVERLGQSRALDRRDPRHRLVYRGPLAYAANAPFGGDEFTAVSFWDQVGVIGLDAHFPLTDHNDPGVAELVSS